MSKISNAIRRRLEVLTAVGLATVSTPTDETAPTPPDDGGETDGR